MWKRREFPCFDAVEAAVDCVCRETVLLQNLAEYGERDDHDSLLRHLRGLSAAAHRGWRELNERLSRTFVSSVDREDVSALVREIAELADALLQLGVLWRTAPPDTDTAKDWTARLAAGGNLLQELVGELPLLRGDNTLADKAEQLYTLRREGDTQMVREARHLRGEALAVARQCHACCTAFARIADTAEWLALKNG